MPRFTSENAAVADDIIARYPIAKSALIPLLHLAQEQDGYLTEEAMRHIAELVEVTPAEVLGTASFYEMFKREPVGDYMVTVCTNISCLLLGGEELLHHLEHRLGVKAGSTTPDGKFTLEDVECIAACSEAPCMQVNYRYFHRVELDEVDELLEDLRAGRLAHEVPRHGTLSRVRQQLPENRAGNALPDRNVEPPWLARNRKANGNGDSKGKANGNGEGDGGKSS
ncbi:MAG TPA: NADH-quinone oxidoreductase subunit NuoE [Acidimicrobiales bacterium]